MPTTINKAKNKILLAKALYELERRKRLNPLNFIKPIDNEKINQKAFLESNKRNLLVLGGNRSGKTLMGAVKTLKILLSKPNAQGWAVTWSDMSILILEKKYSEILPLEEVEFADYNEKRGFQHGLIIFKNGSILKFKTYEQGAKSFQGAKLDVIHLDEEAPEDILKECRARLIDKSGVLIRTMTPVNGLTYTYNEIINSKDPELQYWFWDSRYNPYIPTEDLLRIMEQYPDKERETRLTGHFLNLTSGLAYYNFSSENISDDYSYNPNVTLEISCDFNIDLMYWTISQNYNGDDYIFDYIELENYANTQLMCEMLKDKIKNHRSDIIFYVDYSGYQRRPEASLSNIEIIKSNFPNAVIRSNVIRNIKDRVDAVNLRLRDNDKKPHIFINSKCKRLIADFQQVTWEHLMNKNKAGKLTHPTDALSYMIFDKYSFMNNFEVKIRRY